MRGSRSRRSKSSTALACARPVSRRRSTRSAGSSSRWPAGCPNAARSSPILMGSNSRCWMPIPAASSGCGCVACRHQTATRALPVPDSPPGSSARSAPGGSALRVHPGARLETPLCRLAQEVAGLAGWRRYGLAFVLGALLAGALPPIDMTPLIFIAFPGLLWLNEDSASVWTSARLGYVFGFGFFVAGLYWIAAELFVDIDSFWWALPFAVLGVPALLGTPSLVPLPVWRRMAPALAALLLILLPAAAGAVRLQLFPTVSTATWLRLVQPSIPQTLKWDPSAAEANFHRLIELSASPSDHPIAAVLWPEAAATFLIERDAARRLAIAAVAPKDGYVITGALRANPPPGPVTQVWNSIEAVDHESAIRARYDKAHLVPFGEYIPFGDFLPVRQISVGAIDLSPGPGPQTIVLPGLPGFAPLVCYEAIFPGAVVGLQARPGWILNVTNDAWYGRSSGPFQHFAIARTRAIA